MRDKRDYHYILLDPTGNITALVTDPAPVARQPELASAPTVEKLMAAARRICKGGVR